jgi:hypothetical protein
MQTAITKAIEGRRQSRRSTTKQYTYDNYMGGKILCLGGEQDGVLCESNKQKETITKEQFISIVCSRCCVSASLDSLFLFLLGVCAIKMLFL